jgi:spartin
VPTHDFWLVLNVSTFEAPLIPTQHWALLPKSLEGISYSFPSQTVPTARIVVTFPLPGSTAELEDLDSLEVLLRQYGCLGAEITALTDIEAPHMGLGTNGAGPAPEDMRGRLVLINEDSGEVVGELDQRLDVVEDKMIAQGSSDKPVMLDFGGQVDGYAPQVVVKTVPEAEMDDWILKGAHYMR